MERSTILRIAVLTIVLSISPVVLYGGEDGSGSYPYGPYAKLLKAHVDSKGGVDYQGLKAKRMQLDTIVQGMAEVSEKRYASWPEQERIAFLINVYNALTLKTIVDHYPIRATTKKAPAKSIRQIEGVWDRVKFKLLGKEVTLNRIEHEMLRARFNEPRIHMALVCAALSCPPLRNEPFSAARLDEQLKDQTRRFLLTPSKFKIDRKAKKVYLSQIFNWFGKDFVKTFGTGTRFKGRTEHERAVLNFISPHLGEEDRAFLKRTDIEIVFLHYDWTLNEK